MVIMKHRVLIFGVLNFLLFEILFFIWKPNRFQNFDVYVLLYYLISFLVFLSGSFIYFKIADKIKKKKT